MHPLAQLSLLIIGATAALMPGPSGQFGVGFSQHVVPHLTKDDPTPGPANELLVHLYYPTRDKINNAVPYFSSAKLAKAWNAILDVPTGPEAFLQLTTSLRGNASFLDHATGRPTIFFSPGGLVNAWMYYGQLADLASRGYTVVAVDHPGEPPLVLWPNGTETTGFPLDVALTLPLINRMHEYRVDDLTAVLVWFASYVKQTHAPFDASTFFTMGHSLGGSAAMGAMPRHKGVKAGVNVDGGLWGAATTDVRRPVLMFSSINHTDTDWRDPSWAEFPRHQSAWWQKIAIYGAGHLDYSDLTTWRGVLGFPPQLQAEIGPTGGPRTTDIVRKYLGDFFDWVEGKTGKGVLARPSLRWWEVVYVNGTDFVRKT